MATTYKVLGQNNPTSNTLTTLYTVPASTSAVCSTLSICNLANTSSSFRVAIRPSDAALNNKHYIAYDTPVPSNDTIHLTLGMSLAATDVVSVYAGSSNISFNLFGSEIS